MSKTYLKIEDLVFDPKGYAPRSLSDDDRRRGDELWEALTATLPSTMTTQLKAIEEPEREAIKGYVLAVMTGRDAFTGFSPDESDFASRWVDSCMPGLLRAIQLSWADSNKLLDSEQLD